VRKVALSDQGPDVAGTGLPHAGGAAADGAAADGAAARPGGPALAEPPAPDGDGRRVDQSLLVDEAAAGVHAPAAGAGGEGGGAGDGEVSADGDGGRMPLLEHLAELRTRLVICCTALVVASIAGWFLYNPVLHFMTEPYRAFYRHHRNLISGDLVISSPVEGFTTRLKVSMYIGTALAAPVWLWHVWRFITPGLKKREKHYALPFVLSAMTLFVMGVTVAVLVWPKALDWLISASGSGVAPLFSPAGYVNLYLLICLVFGVVFLYPIVVVFLMIAGVVPSAKWRKWRRPAIVVLCVIAAAVTPSNDPFTFLGMAVPMLVFYEISIIVGRILGK
jgi:sec-independent protein translocase protein TatC